MNIKSIKQYLNKDFFIGIFDLLFKYIPISVYVRLFRRQEQCWLFCERPDEARDNGFVLYKWICTHHPEVRVIYAIHKSSPDFSNVENLGEVIEYGSIKHWYYFFASKACCDTGWGICCPNAFCYILMRNFLPPMSKRVFLQHGIIKDFMPVGLKGKLHADLFVCGAYPEWEYISSNFGYVNNEVKYLGLARFDRLVSTASKSQILYMPTWRSYLENANDITKTKYYSSIISFISSSELNDLLTRTNSEFVFFLHPHIKKFKQYFEKCGTERIRILNNDDCDLQKLICSANILITDFSSIYFDFAYQCKPVIYYHFDYDEYREGHYSEGYFNYERDGFGPIVKDEKDLINSLSYFREKEWIFPEVYAERARRFFPMMDTKNCERHFNELVKL